MNRNKHGEGKQYIKDRGTTVDIEGELESDNDKQRDQPCDGGNNTETATET